MSKHMSDALGAGQDPTQLLSMEVAGFTTLVDLLCAEQEALRAADADALALIAKDKLAQVFELQELGASRARLLEAMAPRAAKARIEALLAQCAQPELARVLWRQLVDLAMVARRRNALNERLAAVQQRHVDHALAALHNAAGCETTYGANGRSQHRSVSQTLAAI